MAIANEGADSANIPFGEPYDYVDARPILVVNPNSTRAARVGGEVREVLRRGGVRVAATVETEYSDAQDNAEMLADELRPGDVLIACGGDGLMNSVANAVRLRRDDGRSVGLVPVPTGNACDISMSMYGRDIVKAGLVDVVTKGSREYMDVVGFSLNGHERWALGYASVGLTAALAATYGDAEYRSGRQSHGTLAVLRDFYEAVHAMAQDRPFAYRECGSENVHTAHDILAANIPRLARFGRIAVVAGRGPVVHELSGDKYVRGVIRAAAALSVRRGLEAEPLVRRDFIITEEADGVWYQLDGEASILRYGSRVGLWREPRSIAIVGAGAYDKRHSGL